MRRAIIGPLALGLALGVVADAAAQDRRGGRGEDDRRDRIEDRRGHRGVPQRHHERRILDRRGDRRVLHRHRDRSILERILLDRHRRTRAHRGHRGPAFCRSGAGHPVFGRRWCHDKGFGLGIRGHRGRRHLRIDRHHGRSLPEIILRRHRHRAHLHHGRLGRADLGEILGLLVLDRVLHELLHLTPYDARRVSGRWYDTRHHDRRGSAWWGAGYRSSAYADGRALQLFLDGERVAELADLDRDGRVDLLLTRR